MKKFAFPLQKVLDHRERLTSLAKEVLVKARAERDAAEAALDAAVTARKNALDARRSIQRKGMIDLDLVRAHLNRFAGIDSDARAAAQSVMIAQHTFDRHAQVYVERKRDVKAMELLKDKRKKEYTRVIRAEEQSIMDDNFSARRVRAAQDKDGIR